MREIKFRGLRLGGEKQFIYGCLTRYSEHMSYITIDLLESEVYQVNTESVGQYTGLKDKNGVEIYEGDITSEGWAICFVNGMFAPYYDYGNQERYEDIGGDWWSDCEVIGNLYENPELTNNQ